MKLEKYVNVNRFNLYGSLEIERLIDVIVTQPFTNDDGDYYYIINLLERVGFEKDMLMRDVNNIRREFGHAKRVGQLSEKLMSCITVDQKRIRKMKIIGFIHDVGKVEINNDILEKKQSLTEDEWLLIKSHPSRGRELLERLNLFVDEALVVEQHHERWDGSGYPNQLKGCDILLEARVLSLADSFDAMTSKRSYSNPLSYENAFCEIQRCSGSQFDPDLVPIFCRMFDW